MSSTSFWPRLLLMSALVAPAIGVAFVMPVAAESKSPAAANASIANVSTTDLEVSLTSTDSVDSIAIPTISEIATPANSIAELTTANRTQTQIHSQTQLELQPVETLTPAAPRVALDRQASEPQATSVQAPAQIPLQTSVQDVGTVLDELDQYNSNPADASGNSLSQVTSITQLSDVQPTDWAYQALQSLVERYGCIAGYPDGTYKGQRAMTRFEFAAGMNACLDRISELIAASTADLATKEDLATVQRLQEEFAAELAALRGRVDGLEARTAELEANQFSTTTKLSGETIFGVAGVFGGGLDDDDGDDDSSLQENNNIIASGRVRLVFDTSFNGTDLLKARLQAGNFGRFNTTDLEGNTVLGNDGRLGFDTDTDNSFQLDILTYQFKLGPASAIVAAQAPDFNDLGFVPVVSPFASAGRGAISRFGRFNPIYRTASGSGGGLSFDFDFASLHLAYLAGEAGSPSPGSGLFNGDYGALAQLTLKPFDALTLAFTYVNSYSGSVENDDGTFSANGFNTGTGSSRSRVRVGDQPIVANSYGAQVNFQVAKFLQIGGWFTYSAVRAIETGDAQVWNYAGTIGFPDLGKKGSLLGFVVGVEPYLGGTSGFTVSDRRKDNQNGLHIEGFYRYQLNDNISITPGVIWLTAPNHDDGNDDALIGTIRTTFTF
jgi:hypothetical protein